MIALRVWLRRGLAVWLAPFLLGILVFGAWSRDGWQYEWLWGGRAVLLMFPLVAPLVAAGVAFDVAQRWAPLAMTLGPSTRRWRRATGALLAAHLLWALACVAVVWAAAAARLLSNGAIGRPDPWLAIEALAALAAASGVGLAVGMRVRSLVAPPLAAVAVFLAPAAVLPFGLSAVFAPTPLVSSAVGLTRDPKAAAMSVALNMAVAAVCFVLAQREPKPTRSYTATAALVVAALIGLLAVPASATPLEYRATTSPGVCVAHGDVQVCGPEEASSLLRRLAGGLEEARDALHNSGLPLPTAFSLGLPGLPIPDDGSTVVFVSPRGLEDDRRAATVAEILALPKVCPQLLEPDATTAPLLDRQERVRAWLDEATTRREAPGAAPQQVVTAYRELAACRPAP